MTRTILMQCDICGSRRKVRPRCGAALINCGKIRIELKRIYCLTDLLTVASSENMHEFSIVMKEAADEEGFGLVCAL